MPKIPDFLRRKTEPLRRRLAPSSPKTDFVPPEISSPAGGVAHEFYNYGLIAGGQNGPDGEQGAYAVARGKSGDVKKFPLPTEGPKAVFLPNGSAGVVRALGKETVLLDIPDLGLYHFRRSDVTDVKAEGSRISPLKKEPAFETEAPVGVNRPELVEDLYDPKLRPATPKRGMRASLFGRVDTSKKVGESTKYEEDRNDRRERGVLVHRSACFSRSFVGGPLRTRGNGEGSAGPASKASLRFGSRRLGRLLRRGSRSSFKSISVAELRAALRAAGFKPGRGKGDHQRWKDDKGHSTYIDAGQDPVDPNLLANDILRQTGLSEDQMFRLLGREDRIRKSDALEVEETVDPILLTSGEEFVVSPIDGYELGAPTKDVAERRADGTVVLGDAFFDLSPEGRRRALARLAKTGSIIVRAALIDPPPVMLARAKEIVTSTVNYFGRKNIVRSLADEARYNRDLPYYVESFKAEIENLPEAIKELGRGQTHEVYIPPLGQASQPTTLVLWGVPGENSFRPSAWAMDTSGRDVKRAKRYDSVDEFTKEVLAQLNRRLKILESNLADIEEMAVLQKEEEEIVKNLSTAKPEGLTEHESESHGIREYVSVDIPVDLSGWRYEKQVDASKLPKTINVTVYPWQASGGEGGHWRADKDMPHLVIFSSSPSTRAPKDTLSRELNTLEHEFAHVAQSLLQWGKDLRLPGGLPAKSTGKDTEATPHSKREIEYYPNIVSELGQFERSTQYKKLSPEQKQQAAREWVEKSQRFKDVKSVDEDRWRKMVTEFLRAVETTKSASIIVRAKKPSPLDGVVDMTGVRLGRLGTIRGIDVVLVDGDKIRDDIDVDYTSGGNPGRYGYVPPNEVWIDDNQDEHDRTASIIHEIAEYHRMLHLQETYEQAHERAAELESLFRSSPQEGDPVEVASAFLDENEDLPDARLDRYKDTADRREKISSVWVTAKTIVPPGEAIAHAVDENWAAIEAAAAEDRTVYERRVKLEHTEAEYTLPEKLVDKLIEILRPVVSKDGARLVIDSVAQVKGAHRQYFMTGKAYKLQDGKSIVKLDLARETGRQPLDLRTFKHELVELLGHELIHIEQFRRQEKSHPPGKEEVAYLSNPQEANAKAWNILRDVIDGGYVTPRELQSGQFPRSLSGDVWTRYLSPDISDDVRKRILRRVVDMFTETSTRAKTQHDHWHKWWLERNYEATEREQKVADDAFWTDYWQRLKSSRSASIIVRAHDMKPRKTIEWNGHTICLEALGGQDRKPDTQYKQHVDFKLIEGMGYFKGLPAEDGDSLDVIVGHDKQSHEVYVVEQLDFDTGEHRQEKVFVDFSSGEEARSAFLSLWPKEMLGALRSVAVEKFDRKALPKLLIEASVRVRVRKSDERDLNSQFHGYKPDGLTVALSSDLRTSTTLVQRQGLGRASIRVTAAGLARLKGLDYLLANKVSNAVVRAMRALQFDISKASIEDVTKKASDELGLHTIRDAVGEEKFVRNRKADELFCALKIVLLSSYASHPSAVAWFDAEARTIGVSLPQLLKGSLKKRTIPTAASLAAQLQPPFSHELRHAIDWAYHEQARPGSWREKNPHPSLQDPTRSNSSLPSELIAYAGNVAYAVWLRGEKSFAQKGGDLATIISNITRQLYPTLLEGMTPEARRTFLQRVVSRLQAMKAEPKTEGKVPPIYERSASLRLNGKRRITSLTVTAAGPLGINELQEYMTRPETFGVVSAYTKTSKKQNQTAHGELYRDLLKSYPASSIRPLRGQYEGVAEQSFLVFGADLYPLLDLAKKYQQDSVLFKGKDGTVGIYKTNGGLNLAETPEGRPAVGQEALSVAQRGPKEEKQGPPSKSDLWSKGRSVSFEAPINWARSNLTHSGRPVTVDEARRMLREPKEVRVARSSAFSARPRTFKSSGAVGLE